jgi:hypothetical protein
MFITGCRSYKLDSVSKHEKSKGHEKSAAIAKAKSENFEKLNKMFRTCHANSSTRMRRPNLKDKIKDNTCNSFKMSCLRSSILSKRLCISYSLSLLMLQVSVIFAAGVVLCTISD